MKKRSDAPNRRPMAKARLAARAGFEDDAVFNRAILLRWLAA